MDSISHLADYLKQVTAYCRWQLAQWYTVEELQLDQLALTALHFLHTAIDQNESIVGPKENYLLLVPDVTLADSALGGALMGALLGKYRANYIMAEATPLAYEVDDILLRIPRKGAPELQQVKREKDGAIEALTEYPRSKTLLGSPRHRNFVKLLPKEKAQAMGFGSYTTSSVAKLGNNIVGVQKLVRGIEGIVAYFPHRLGLICSPVALENLEAHLPLPIRSWTRNGPQLRLPLAPLVEAARSYSTLKHTAFARAQTKLVCDELLILDANNYCNGNGLFDEIQDGRSAGRYRNLILVGSRYPKGQHDFRTWEWTPEELAILRGLPCRAPVVYPCAAPELREVYQALKHRVSELADADGLSLPGLLTSAGLFCRLVLPPATPGTQSEAIRQTAGLVAWIAEKMPDDAFAAADVWGDERTEIRADVLRRFEALAAAIRQRNAKFEAVRLACAAPAAASWPKSQAKRGKLPPVVLVLPRREAAATEAALRAALTPGHAARLRVVPVQHLEWAVAQAALNRPEATWLLPGLRLSREEGGELTLYRQLLLLRAEVKILAYEGIEEGRAAQVAAHHHRLVEAALLHPGRAHFVGSLLPARPGSVAAPAPAVAPALAANLPAELPAITYVPAAPPTPAASAQFAELDALFGPLSEKEIKAWLPAATPAADTIAAADQPDTPEPALPDELTTEDDPEETSASRLTCLLRFSDGSEEWLAATASVYIRPPGLAVWQARIVAQLLPGDDVFVVKASPQVVRAELASRQRATMQEIDSMTDCWKNVLRGLWRDFYHQDTDALHRKLQWKGLRVRRSSLASWLNPDGPTRFPEAHGDLVAIAELESHHRGNQAALAARLPRMAAARRYNDRAVAGYGRSINSQVHKYLQNNQALPDEPLATLLRATHPRRLLSLVLADYQ